MSDLEPITREEVLLNSIAEGTGSDLEPITRQEMYLSAIAGESDLPEGMEPITREEIYYQKILDNGGSGGGEATGTKTININSNGTTSHNVKAYATAEITTNVPNSYSASDEGKVVSNGALASQTSRNVTANGTYDTTVNDEVAVNVPNPSTGTKSITQNGTHDVTDYASAQVNVPNSYSASDEGKVVSNGTLTAQTSRQITANGTVDTTLNNEVVVNVPSITKVEGDFTIVNDVNGNFPTLTHNFHTQKIALLVYPTSTIDFPAGYRGFYAAWINASALLDSSTWELDFTSYNTNFTEVTEVSLPNNKLREGTIMQSPWASQNQWYSAQQPAFLEHGDVTVTDDTVKINQLTSTARFQIGSYHYIIWKLED